MSRDAKFQPKSLKEGRWEVDSVGPETIQSRVGFWLEFMAVMLKALDRLPGHVRELLLREYGLAEIPSRGDTSTLPAAARHRALARARGKLLIALEELSTQEDLPNTAERFLDLLRRRDAYRALADLVAIPDPEPADEIGALYDELAVLTSDANAESDSGLQQRIDAAWSRLRELQEVEAERFQEEFEERLSMPIDAGAQILARARELRRELEDLTSPDSPGKGTDTSSS